MSKPTDPRGATYAIGNVLDVLPTLDADRFQCCVTSPPYWGLRDYGTARWDGGEAECDHIEMATGMSGKNTLGHAGHLPSTNAANIGRVRQFRGACGKCGAARVDDQLGLEPTPDAYVANMVRVFREVRRTMTADGLLFLNIGDSYSATSYGRIRDDEREAFFRLPVAVRRQVFGLWRSVGGRTLPRDVCALLSACMEESAPRQDERAREAQIREDQGGVQSKDSREEQAPTGVNDSDAWREVRLLRRDGADVPLPGPHQGRRAEGLREEGRDGGCVEACDPGRTEQGALSRAVLELQCRAWTLRSVRSLQLDLADVPREARGLFDVEIRPKDLVGIPWAVAFALRADGWYLRSEVIWQKPSPMPESVTDRPTKAHEQVFLLAKSSKYYYDGAAIREAAVVPFDPSAREPTRGEAYGASRSVGGLNAADRDGNFNPAEDNTRNARSVWTIASQPFAGAHFATMPPKLAERCILAGSRIGDEVLDPFLGSGTVGMVAESLGRRWFGVELNPAYEALIKQRTAQVGLFGRNVA